MLVESCVDFGYPSNKNLDTSSVTMFSDPKIYCISGPYSSSINLHRNTMLVLNLLKLVFCV